MSDTSRSYTSPLRLVAQDIGFSVLVQGFDSPRGYPRQKVVFLPFFMVLVIFVSCFRFLRDQRSFSAMAD